MNAKQNKIKSFFIIFFKIMLVANVIGWIGGYFGFEDALFFIVLCGLIFMVVYYILDFLWTLLGHKSSLEEMSETDEINVSLNSDPLVQSLSFQNKQQLVDTFRSSTEFPPADKISSVQHNQKKNSHLKKILFCIFAVVAYLLCKWYYLGIVVFGVSVLISAGYFCCLVYYCATGRVGLNVSHCLFAWSILDIVLAARVEMHPIGWIPVIIFFTASIMLGVDSVLHKGDACHWRLF